MPLSEHREDIFSCFSLSKVRLAEELEALGVDVIQTEGKYSLDPSR